MSEIDSSNSVDISKVKIYNDNENVDFGIKIENEDIKLKK